MLRVLWWVQVWALQGQTHQPHGAVAEHGGRHVGYVPCAGWKISSQLTWLAFSRFVMIMATSSAL